MKTPAHFRTFRLALFLIAVIWVSTPAQEKVQPKQTPDDDVVRVTTNLVQTDVMVFDKQNSFVEGLKPEQFQVKINGTPVTISFVEQVTTGSSEEKAQIAAARGGRPITVTGEKAPTPITVVEGRSLFLFVDDLHLDGESLIRTKKMLANTIDEMTANDRAVIVTATGQLGPQNLSSDKTFLKATIEKIALRARVRESIESPTMSEGAAIAIDRGDTAVIDFYVRRLRDPATSQEQLQEMVKGRAARIIEQAAPFASNTLTSLENFIRELANVPGRKLLFFVSDGFMIENQRSMSYARLRGATEEAARAGVVIYALNARGLQTSFPDASVGDGFDPALSRAVYGADKETHEVLYSLALDTGGRATINNNDINLGIRQALAETARYYLLAWKPPQEVADQGKVKKVEVNIIGRPDLKVRTRRGIAEAISSSLTASNNPLNAMATAPSGGSELMTALAAPSLQVEVPTALVLAYQKSTGGNFAIRASMQTPISAITFEDNMGRKIANLDVAAIVQDQTGKQVSTFNKRIAIASDSNAIDPTRKLAFYNHDAALPPGSYKVTVGVRDSKTGRIGAVAQTFVIPDISAGQLALSSLLLNEHTEADDDEETADRVGVRKGVARNFGQESRMRFLTYVYNAAPTAADDPEPDLEVEVKVMRGDQAVLNPALREMEINRGNDAKAYPYLAEIPLTGLKPGQYTLQVVITDKTTKASATQRATFVVD